MAGQQTLNLYMEVRLLHPQSEKTRFYRVFALTSAWERETAAKNSLIRYNDAY